MKKYLTLIFCIVVTIPFTVVAAPESTTSANIIQLRPYVSGGVYIHLDSNILCDTSVFLIDGSNAGKEVLYSAALAAFMGNKKIRVEALTSTGCVGWGTALQSLYLVHN